MRRLTIMIAILGLTLPSSAAADPFENLSSRVQSYEQVQGSSPAPSGGSAPEEVEPVPMSGESYDDPSGQYILGDGYEESWGGPMGEPDVCCSGWGPCRRWGPCGGCGGCCGGGLQPNFWGRAEYLAWWVRGAHVPALLTTSPTGTSVGQAGVLPDATVLFGNQQINTKARSGGRFTLGYWFDPCEQLGIEDTFFFIGGSHQGYSASSTGSPILARPFFDTSTQAQNADLLAFPAVVTGSINITSARTIASNEINIRRGLYNDGWRRFDVLVGYRYFRLSDGLNIRTNTTSLQTSPGTQFDINDSFNTVNNFNGGQLALNMQYNRGLWTLDLLGKVAIGGVSQRALVNGSTVTVDTNGSTTTATGGVLALPSNIGNHKQTTFGVLPEFDINLRYQWTPLWRLNIGYTFMALTNVLRAGDQISLNVDPAQFPPGTTGTFPVYAFNQSDVWLQGINVGLECNF